MIVFNTYLKIVKKQYPMILIYLGITLFFALFATSTSTENVTSYIAEKPKITIINNDEDTKFFQNFKNYISENAEILEIENDTDKLADALFYGETDLIMIIPAGYTKSFFEGDNLQIEMKKSTSSYSSFTQMLLEKYLNIAKAYNIAGMTEDEIIIKINEDLKNVIDVKVENKLNTGMLAKVKFYYNFANYGFLVLCIYISSIVIREFNELKLKRRNLISKTSYKKINFQILLGNSTLAFAIWILYVGISMVLYSDIMLTTNGMLFIINSLIFCITAITIGTFVGNIVKNKDAINGIVNIIALGSSFICGSFVPQEYLPTWVLKIARILPSYWFITNNNNIADTTNFTSKITNNLILYMGIILIFAVIFILLNNFVSWRRQKEET